MQVPESMDDESRYQDQPPWVRLWRRRHQLRAPYWAIKYWLSDDEHLRRRWGNCWLMAMADADVLMRWWYTGEEVDAMLGPKKERDHG